MRTTGPFLLLTLCLPLLMGAEVYRWVDASGVVNYTQTKPRGVDAQQLQTRGGGPTVVSDAPAVAAVPASVGPTAGDLDQSEQTRQQQVAQIKQENCSMARNILGRLTLRNRVSETDVNGETRVLPEEERQARIKEAQDAIVDNCVS
jgi:hypothetical protein